MLSKKQLFSSRRLSRVQPALAAKVLLNSNHKCHGPVWPGGNKVLIWQEDGRRFDSATAFLSLQKPVVVCGHCPLTSPLATDKT